MTIVRTEVAPQQVSDQFVTALEGGSNYWLQACSPSRETKAKATAESPWYADAQVFDGEFSIRLTYDNPNDGDQYVTKQIGKDDVRRGLEVMAEKYPWHFGDLTAETGDVITADVFLQCVLFGDVVFG